MTSPSREPFSPPSLTQLVELSTHLHERHGTAPGEPEYPELWHALYSFLFAGQGQWQKHFFKSHHTVNPEDVAAVPGSKLCEKQDSCLRDLADESPMRQSICGKVFGPGDVMFSCADCGRDESCVFCSDCFSPDQHQDHDVNFTTNQGAPISCVCPDAEAWKQPFDCPCHGLDKTEPNADLPDELVHALRHTIAAMLDFICTALAASPATMAPPSSPQNIPQMPSFSDLQQGRPSASSEKGPWSVVLWNDEKHSYDQVILQLCRALPGTMTRQTALQSANRVDSIGREVVLTSYETTLLYTVARVISNIDLACTIATSQSTFFESVAGVMISVLEDLSRTAVVSPDGTMRLYRPIRYIIAEELLRKDPENRHSSRMVKLLQADVKLWKKARLSLRALYSQLLVLGGDIRSTLASHFIIVYPKLFNRYLLTDREPEYSIIQLTTQLFSVPNAATSLLKKNDAGSTLVALLYSFFTEQVNRRTKTLLFPPNLVSQPADAESAMLKHKRYVWPFMDINRLLKSPEGQKEAVATIDFSDHFINFVLLFHAFNPMVRQTGRHVEYENEAWVNAFNVSAILGKTCRAVGQCFQHATERILLDRIVTVLKLLEGKNACRRHLASFAGRCEEIVSFQVSSQSVSFHYPLSWCLAELFRHARRLDVTPSDGEPPFWEWVLATFPTQFHFLAAIDPAIRVSSLLAQCKAGLWVRNGMGMRFQQMHYRESSLRDVTLDQESFLLQIAFCLVEPDALFITLLDRFEIREWLAGQAAVAPDFETAQFVTLVEEFLTLLTVLLGEPAGMAGWPQDRRVRREVLQALALGPCSHSELLKRCSEVDHDLQMVHQALEEVAVYRPPIGTTDQGFYSLKKELHSELNPFYYRYNRNQRDECSRAIRSTLSPDEADHHVVLPQPLNIASPSFSALLHAFDSPVLTEIIAQCLWCSLSDTSKEIADALLELTLHLIILALVNKPDIFKQNASRPTFYYKEDTSLVDLLQQAHRSSSGNLKASIAWCLSHLGVDISTSSSQANPALPSPSIAEAEAKKAAAKARQAAIMAQFSDAQRVFLDNIEDEDEDEEDGEGDTIMEGDHAATKSFGSCIVCQEELNSNSAFGALALIQASNLIRLHKMESSTELTDNALGLKAGFPMKSRSGLHASSCGHMMHISCFETYCHSVEVRHQSNPTRRHPEDLSRREFTCPLCKTLGNIVVPYPDAYGTDSASEEGPVTDPLAAFEQWAQDIAAEAEDPQVRSLLQPRDGHRLDAFAIRERLPIPANEILQSVSASQRQILDRIMQVSFALTMESHWSDREGLSYYLPDELIAYTVSSIEVASRSQATVAEPTLDSDQQSSKMLAVVKSLISILPELAAIAAGTPKGVDLSATAALLGAFDPTSPRSDLTLVWREPIAFLVESLALSPQHSSPVCNMAFYSEMTRIAAVVAALGHRELTSRFQDVVAPAESLSQLAAFVVDLALRRGLVVPPVSASLVGKAAHALVMPFLRRACLVKRAVFTSPSGSTASESISSQANFKTCLEGLQIVPLEQVFKNAESQLVQWLDRWGKAYLEASAATGVSPLSNVEYSGTYELVSLPWRLDELFSRTRSAVCKRCETTPSNAAICLLCGEMLCFQSFCCMDNQRAEAMYGECNTHMWRCGGSSGMYFLTSRCMVLQLHGNDAGAFTSPPYLDAYGEVDSGHKRHRPQFLSPARFQELRMQWLSQSVPTIVARRLEASVDLGGWETM